MSGKMCVRLWPVNPRQGRELVNYTYKGQTYKGGYRPQWYICSSAMAQELGALRQDDSNPTSPTHFQVLPETDKLQVEQEEHLQYMAQLGVIQGAVTIKTDLHGPPTHTLRESVAAAEEAPAPDLAGRAAALPPPRQPTRTETPTASSMGAITAADLKPVVAPPPEPVIEAAPEPVIEATPEPEPEPEVVVDTYDAADAYDAEAEVDELGPVTTSRKRRGR